MHVLTTSRRLWAAMLVLVVFPTATEAVPVAFSQDVVLMSGHELVLTLNDVTNPDPGLAEFEILIEISRAYSRSGLVGPLDCSINCGQTAPVTTDPVFREQFAYVPSESIRFAGTAILNAISSSLVITSDPQFPATSTGSTGSFIDLYLDYPTTDLSAAPAILPPPSTLSARVHVVVPIAPQETLELYVGAPASPFGGARLVENWYYVDGQAVLYSTPQGLPSSSYSNARIDVSPVIPEPSAALLFPVGVMVVIGARRSLRGTATLG